MTRYLPGVAEMVLAISFSASAIAAESDWARVSEALGKPGTEMPGGVYRVGLPRTDLKVTLDGVDIKPGFALGGWLGFEKSASQSDAGRLAQGLKAALSHRGDAATPS